jgi:hypothetical protein
VNDRHLMVLTADGRVWSSQFPVGALAPVKHIAAWPYCCGGIADEWESRRTRMTIAKDCLAIPVTAEGISGNFSTPVSCFGVAQ